MSAERPNPEAEAAAQIAEAAQQNRLETEQAKPADKENKKEKRKIYIVDTSEGLESQARDLAEEELTAERASLRGVKGWTKRVWKYNWGREIIRQRKISEIREKIKAQDNLFAKEGNDRTAHDEAVAAIIERFASEYDGALHQGKDGKGEKKEVYDDPGVQKELKGLLEAYAKGALKDENFNEEKARIFSSLKGPKNVINRGEMYASNLFEIAKQCKQAVEHGERLEDLDLDLEIVLGRARSGVRTEANFNAVDKIVEKIKNNRFGSLLNETTVSTAVAVAYTVGVQGSQRLARSKMTALGTFGASAVFGLGVAAARERVRLEEERRQHGREIAKGLKVSDKEKSPRRQEMEKHRIETKESNALATELEQILYTFKVGKNGVLSREMRGLTPEAYQEALVKIGEITGRIEYSDLKNLDLISYSDPKKIEQERTFLDILVAKAKADLRAYTDSHREELKIGTQNLDYALRKYKNAFIDAEVNREGGIKEKDAAFRKMKRQQVGKAAIKGLLTGLAVGTIGQEVTSLFRHDQIGLGETVSDYFRKRANHARDGEHYTALAAAFTKWFKGDIEKVNPNFQEQAVAGHHYVMPEWLKLEQASDKSYNLLHHADIVGRHVVDQAGNYNQYAAGELSKHNIFASNYENQVTIPQQHLVNPISGDHVTPKELLEIRHFEGTRHVTRDLWYDEDTPKIFEKNELKLWWGGHEGTGIDEAGNYVYNIRHMAPDGSYHGNFSADAQALMREGKLKMIISLSRDTQNHVFEVPIDAHGDAVIDPNSELGKLAFTTVNGHAKFIGKFAEVAQDIGEKNGVDHVRLLATDIGHGLDHVEASQLPPTIQSGEIVQHIPYTKFDMPADYIVDAPPVIPVLGRYPLEPVSKRQKSENRLLPVRMADKEVVEKESKEETVAVKTTELWKTNALGLFAYEINQLAFEKQKLNLDDLKQTDKLRQEIQIAVNRAMQDMHPEGATTTSPEITRSLGWLGIKFVPVSEVSVEITDISLLIESAKAEQQIINPEPSQPSQANDLENVLDREKEEVPEILNFSEMFRDLHRANGTDFFVNSDRVNWSAIAKSAESSEGLRSLREALQEEMEYFLVKSDSREIADNILSAWAKRKGINYDLVGGRVVVGAISVARLTNSSREMKRSFGGFKKPELLKPAQQRRLTSTQARLYFSRELSFIKKGRWNPETESLVVLLQQIEDLGPALKSIDFENRNTPKIFAESLQNAINERIRSENLNLNENYKSESASTIRQLKEMGIVAEIVGGNIKIINSNTFLRRMQAMK